MSKQIKATPHGISHGSLMGFNQSDHTDLQQYIDNVVVAFSEAPKGKPIDSKTDRGINVSKTKYPKRLK